MFNTNNNNNNNIPNKRNKNNDDNNNNNLLNNPYSQHLKLFIVSGTFKSTTATIQI